MPDRALQVEMLHDCIKNRVTPGVMVLLTGDGAGYARGKGFQVTLESVHSMGWSVSWVNNCNRRLQRWVEGHGKFYALLGDNLSGGLKELQVHRCLPPFTVCRPETEGSLNHTCSHQVIHALPTQLIPLTSPAGRLELLKELEQKEV